MPALQQMFSLPLAPGRPGARGRARVGGGDLWLKELSLGLSAPRAAAEFRSSASRSYEPDLACQLTPWEQPAAGFRVPAFSQMPFFWGGVLTCCPSSPKPPRSRGGKIPQAPCQSTGSERAGRRWRSSPDFRTQPIGRGAGFPVPSDTCFSLNDSHDGLLNSL